MADFTPVFFDVDLRAAELSVGDWIAAADQTFTFAKAREIGGDAVPTGLLGLILVARKVTNGAATNDKHKNGWIEHQGSGWYAQLDLRDFAFERLVQSYVNGWSGRTTLMIGAATQGQWVKGKEAGVDGVTVIYNWAAE